jgi:hypothetical protein
LKHYRQLKAVAKIQEARRRRAHHQWQTGNQVRFGYAELLPIIYSYHHDPVAGQVIGKRDFYSRFTLCVGAHRRSKDSQRIEIGPHPDGLSSRSASPTFLSSFHGRSRGHLHIIERFACTLRYDLCRAKAIARILGQCLRVRQDNA